jgi:hypothetical protein
MHRLRILVSLVATMSVSRAPSRADPVATPNDNRVPAGHRVGDTLVLRLSVSPAAWQILGDSAAPLRVLAFAEEGKAPSIPAPLIRVSAGTPVRVVIQNPLQDTLTVHGLGEHGALDSLMILPSATSELRFVAQREGTHQYWATSAEAQRLVPPPLREPGLFRPRFDSQLAGGVLAHFGPAADASALAMTRSNTSRVGGNGLVALISSVCRRWTSERQPRHQRGHKRRGPRHHQARSRVNRLGQPARDRGANRRRAKKDD